MVALEPGLVQDLAQDLAPHQWEAQVVLELELVPQEWVAKSVWEVVQELVLHWWEAMVV